MDQLHPTATIKSRSNKTPAFFLSPPSSFTRYFLSPHNFSIFYSLSLCYSLWFFITTPSIFINSLSRWVYCLYFRVFQLILGHIQLHSSLIFVLIFVWFSLISAHIVYQFVSIMFYFVFFIDFSFIFVFLSSYQVDFAYFRYCPVFSFFW